MNKKDIKSFTKRLVSESIVGGKIDTTNVINTIEAITKAPYPYNRMILEEYGKLITIEKQKRTLTITSAHTIDGDRTKDLSTQWNKGMDFVDCRIDESLIAGLTIANADYVVDLSLKREINDLERTLL